MAFRPPQIFEVLFTHTLRNGNEQRLQVVTFGKPPRGVVGLEVREYIRPGNPVPGAGTYRDAHGWIMGLDKVWRQEHWQWVLEHADHVREADARARAVFAGEVLDGFGRMRDPEGYGPGG